MFGWFSSGQKPFYLANFSAQLYNYVRISSLDYMANGTVVMATYNIAKG